MLYFPGRSCQRIALIYCVLLSNFTMTMDHLSTSEDAAKRNEAGERSPLQQVLKIAALAVQARTSKGDNHATLNILREARVLTREWGDHAAAELSRASNHGHGHGKEERRTHGSKAAKAGPSSDESPLALLARLALMGWKVFRARGEERVSVKLDALRELHQILILRLEDADREIRRLERALG